MLNPEHFEPELYVLSPGRINLIGEHIDYNGGTVLPAAINKTISLKFRKNHSNTCKVLSVNINSGFSFPTELIEKSSEQWHNYILGVVHNMMQSKPGFIKGFDCIIDSNLPLGSGLSSSAALECGLAKGLDALFAMGLSDLEIISLSRDAEHHFVGTKCGIMDQFAVVKGRANHLLKLNCATLNHRLIKADFNPYAIVLLNSNVSHNLASSAYNTRREECTLALKSITAHYPEYKYLVDIPPRVVEEFETKLPPNLYNRALYVSQEQRRTLEAVSFLETGDLEGLGQCLFESHHGLQYLYNVSCDELDFLVGFAKSSDSNIGARLMGGGFGGCTINLVQKHRVNEFIEAASTAYKNKFGMDLSPIEISIGDGVKLR